MNLILLLSFLFNLAGGFVFYETCQANDINSAKLQSMKSLKDYRWKNRLLLVVASSKDTKLWLTQKRSFEEHKSEAEDRDLLLLQIKPAEMHLLKKYGLDLNDTSFRVLLIGKDGDLKNKFTKPVDINLIFELIDAMPMRVQEMNK